MADQVKPGQVRSDGFHNHNEHFNSRSSRYDFTKKPARCHGEDAGVGDGISPQTFPLGSRPVSSHGWNVRHENVRHDVRRNARDEK